MSGRCQPNPGSTTGRCQAERRYGAASLIITAAIAVANTWLANYAGKLPYDVGPGLPEGQEAVALANMLEQYNNGILPGGPPNCPQ